MLERRSTVLVISRKHSGSSVSFGIVGATGHAGRSVQHWTLCRAAERKAPWLLRWRVLWQSCVS